MCEYLITHHWNYKWIDEEIKSEIKNTLRQIQIQHTKVMGCSKAVMRGKFIIINACKKKQEKSQTKNLTLHLREPEKEEQTTSKVNRRKERLGQK